MLQACTEMVMPMCSDGELDMFEPAQWNLTQYSADCEKRWGVIPRPDWIITQYGGLNISTASNIIFRFVFKLHCCGQSALMESWWGLLQH